jgi:hypothetical protein
VAWCENRCKFGWNGQAVTGSRESPILSRLFRVAFVPPGKLGFLALRRDGVVEGFIEELEERGLQRFQLKLTEAADRLSILAQRGSGSILAVVGQGCVLQLFEFASLQDSGAITTTTTTTLFLGQVSLATAPSKLVYHDSRRELSVFGCDSAGNQVILQKFNLQSDSIRELGERHIELPFAPASIVHSPRAAGVFVGMERGLLALLNDDGDLMKTHTLPVEGGADLLLLSPNGLCLGQVSLINDLIPILVTQPVAELNPKSR